MVINMDVPQPPIQWKPTNNHVHTLSANLFSIFILLGYKIICFLGYNKKGLWIQKKKIIKGDLHNFFIFLIFPGFKKTFRGYLDCILVFIGQPRHTGFKLNTVVPRLVYAVNTLLPTVNLKNRDKAYDDISAHANRGHRSCVYTGNTCPSMYRLQYHPHQKHDFSKLYTVFVLSSVKKLG